MCGNFLKALAEEIDIALRCLGKTSLQELYKDDLVALTEEMAKITVRIGLCGAATTKCVRGMYVKPILKWQYDQF